MDGWFDHLRDNVQEWMDALGMGAWAVVWIHQSTGGWMHGRVDGCMHAPMLGWLAGQTDMWTAGLVGRGTDGLGGWMYMEGISVGIGLMPDFSKLSTLALEHVFI